jgi:hypothetical protein
MTAPQVLKACAQEAHLPFLVIGGFAVIAHGYQRSTGDLDVLVRRSDDTAWTEALKRVGYTLLHAQRTFAQYKSADGSIDLDLMYVDDATFDPMYAASEPKDFHGVPIKVPSLEHLVALKLHVLKQDLRHRRLYDADDIIQLVLRNKIDLRESKWQALFEKYGTLEWYEKIRHATQP